MLTTSMEYLHALRAEKYLQFLEWPEFVIQLYQIKDADDLVVLLIYEWIKNGFCEEDAKKIALLCAVEDADAKNRVVLVDDSSDEFLKYKPVFPGKLSYALTNLCIVVLHCMAFQRHNQHHNIISAEKLDQSAAISLVKASMAGIDESKYQQCLLAQKELFYSWPESLDPQSIMEISQAIKSITELRYVLEQYLTTLESDHMSTDQFKISRISIVQSLAKYLNDQVELTPQVMERIEKYVTTIRELQPAVYEEDYLHFLAPLPLFDSAFNMVLKYGRSFFGISEKPAAEELPAVINTI